MTYDNEGKNDSTVLNKHFQSFPLLPSFSVKILKMAIK